MPQTARDIITEIVRLGAAPVTQKAGFKKSGLTFFRRYGDTLQVINIQLSQGNVGDEGSFYVNVGIAVDALQALSGKPVTEQPKEYECQFRARLERLVPEVPAVWRVDASTAVPPTADALAGCLSALMAQLEPLSTAEALLNHPRVAEDALLRAQLLYVTGQLDDCRAALQAAAEQFRDRRNSTVVDFIARYHLTRLQS